MKYAFSPDAYIFPCVATLKSHFEEIGAIILEDKGCNFVVNYDGKFNETQLCDWVIREI